MNNKNFNVLPVLFTFFIMGFCDVVGIATSYVKNDFHLSETMAGFIPTMVFLWFLLLSVPTALVMNKIGRKLTVQISNVITFIGMIIPLVAYNFTTCLVAFALLGIGNTILQVSLNPLVTNVISGKALTSSLTAGQVIKAISSFCGPLIAAYATYLLGSWQYIFPTYALVTLLASVWLWLTPVPREVIDGEPSSVGKTFALLKDRTILLLSLGIVFVVGLDVGINTVAPKLLIERVGMSVETAGFASSVYFLCRTIGAFIGAFVLTKLSGIKYFRVNILIALALMAGLFFVNDKIAILALVGGIGFTCSCIFSIIYSAALSARPNKANEISGLMITGIFGGAVVPPLMGFCADSMGSQAGSLLVITICIGYLVFCSLRLRNAPGK